ncbi:MULTISPECIES: bifunctional aspartate kinase/diaminopimelate decarboxylase [unclassified Rhodanobacter]|uniref:bifunctional aspartate kinase/diaminopimelate decarboxylase n=1 Tax=unclassified Rhodanobacter TaxID=2621553 RepID=UPI001BE0AC05|nr:MULTISPECIES: bifunctional aspartate kinase/diaminopimelate decarboxylase [unclassified Rhodanobacter]MBT2145418.1 bifunctional aspartate kinase/diaminopimelate decarboxylase [Rhodanobacter sp. LX-99]MBT2149463.1 bifunctional aspartate kinase/diaminopimelate decarboxylase [Rhodanobacter sp. LX-100]
MKFGGTSVATLPRWQNIRELVASRRAEGARVLVVVSALTGVTDALKQLCGEGGQDKRKAAAGAIAQRHYDLLEHMQLALPDTLGERLGELARLAEAGPAARGELAWQAQVQAHGELMSSALGAAFLSHSGLPTQWLDARDCLAAVALPNQNERTRLLSAMVEAKPDPALNARLAALGEVFITQGFIAREQHGRTVLLGRGGSDTSAAYFGALLKAARVEIWTDVAGMFTANPRQVPGARLLQRLDYEEAQEIASTGAKVLHPRCLSPLREPRVPLLIKDTNRPELEGTVIGPEVRAHAPSVKAISARKGITLVSMESVGMWQQVGFLADVFAHFKQHGLSVDLIGSAETNVTVSLDPTENLLDSDAIAALASDLAKVCRVKVIAPCAAITLVGRGMRSLLHTLSGVLAEFGQLRVHMISQSSNNLNLTFVVDEEVVDALLPHLHDLLIGAGALRTDDSALFGPSWQMLYGGGEAVPAVPAWWRQAQRPRLLELAAEATPRYVYHLPTVRQQARELKSLAAVDRLHYAVKANTHPAILRALAAEGFAFECVSPGELKAVAAVVAESVPLLFTPNFAPREDYVYALGTRATVTLDALHPLQHWGELFRGREIVLRVDLGRGLGHHEKVRTGGSGSKFGLPLDQLPLFLQLAETHGVSVRGLHAHLGSGVLDAAHWGEVYAQLASLAERIGSVVFLNIGGGLGVPAHPGEAPLDIAALDRALREVKAVYPQYQLWMEPGRYLVADAGVLLTRVTQQKDKGGFRYLGVDTGMNSLIRPALYDAWHKIVNLSRLGEPATALYQVVGPICESGDVLGTDRRLQEAQEGDVILIAQAGAYGKVMSSHYNLRDEADEVVIDA